MENSTSNSLTLHLEGLLLSRDTSTPIFLFLLFSYLFVVVANAVMILLIFCDRNLHQPMYLLYNNLSINDLLGNTIVIPRVLWDMLRPPSQRLISFYECVLQAFLIHVSNTASFTVLMIMTFDRYVAICNPLRYASIMTNRMVLKLIVWAWGAAILVVGVMLALTVRLNRCRTVMKGLYCSNASLFKLSCESVLVNNMYGLTFTVALFTSSIGSMLLTYTKITVVCLTNRDKSLNRKAFQTCSTHLVVYMILLLCAMTVISLHRFPLAKETKKIFAVLYHIVPGSLNPIIYGMQSKEVQKFLLKFFESKSKKVFAS